MRTRGTRQGQATVSGERGPPNDRPVGVLSLVTRVPRVPLGDGHLRALQNRQVATSPSCEGAATTGMSIVPALFLASARRRDMMVLAVDCGTHDVWACRGPVLFSAIMTLDALMGPRYTLRCSEITEQGENPWRARRCNRGPSPQEVTVLPSAEWEDETMERSGSQKTVSDAKDLGAGRP